MTGTGCRITDNAIRDESGDYDTASACPGDCKRHCSKCGRDYMCPHWYDETKKTITIKCIQCQKVLFSFTGTEEQKEGLDLFCKDCYESAPHDPFKTDVKDKKCPMCIEGHPIPCPDCQKDMEKPVLHVDQEVQAEIRRLGKSHSSQSKDGGECQHV